MNLTPSVKINRIAKLKQDTPLFQPDTEEKLYRIYSMTDVEAFPAVCLELLLDAAWACAGSFFIWDEFQKEFRMKAARGPYRDSLQDTCIKLREGILGWVGGEGASVLVTDIRSDKRFQTYQRCGQYHSHSFISIPLTANHKLIGVVNLTEKEQKAPFTEKDFEVAQTIAKHISLAFANLRSFQTLQKENEQLYLSAAKLQREKKEQENFIQMGKLAANLAHELNNPLDAIRRYVNLALDQSLEHSLTKEYLLKARKGIRRTIRIIRNLLELVASSKQQAPRVEAHLLLEQSLEILEDPAFEKIHVRKIFCATPSYIADRGISMVLHNLYHNARHAMHGAGTLTLTTHRGEHSFTIVVEDTGCGIPKSNHGQVFEPLFSTKNSGEGTGIGLSLCREIVERCGGKIHCDDTLHQGARFIITLPCQEQGEK